MPVNNIIQRENVPQKSTWNKEIVYSSWLEWQDDFQKATDELPELKEFEGKLTSSQSVLADWFELQSKHYSRIQKMFTYARMATVVDSTDEEAKGYWGQINSLMSKFGAVSAFANPEILSLGEGLMEWAAKDPRLDIYKHNFNNLIREKKHRRSAEVEQILKMIEDPFSATIQTANELTNTDMKFSDAVDSNKRSHSVYQSTLPPAGITSSDREHRKTAWENFSDGHLELQNTLASNYIGLVKQNVFLANSRGYDSVLELRLASRNLPVSYFHNLIDTFKNNLHVWHRYWDVRRKILKLDKIHPYDRWAPIVDNPPQIKYQEAVELIAQALLPLGQDYVDLLNKGCLEDRWVDYSPNIEKRQGAASSLSVGTPPFIFMSYDDTLMGMSVLAHELGHSMHLHYSAKNQPSVYNNMEIYSSSITETASNFNQAMTRAYLKELYRDDKDFQLALIDEAMYNFLRYFFIMPTLARFEYEVFDRAEKGEPLSASILNEIMGNYFSEGYGDTLVDDPGRTAITWAQFVHLYYPFYTFQYSIGISAANTLADSVLNGGSQAANDYRMFLNAGASKYPEDLFNLAGVDMSSPEPIEKAFSYMEGLIDQLDKLTS